MSPRPKPPAALDAARAISLATARLCACEDRDSLFRTAVESARDLLGMERCAIFLRDGDAVRGTFGTDRSGATRDEREHRFVPEETWEELFRVAAGSGEPPTYVCKDHHYAEWDGEKAVLFGRGPVVFTPVLWQQNRMVAVFCNDNAVSGRPIDRFQQDLLHVYCSVLGGILGKWSSEELLRSAQKMEALGSMAGNVAHDFNNFLAVIAGNVGLISRVVPEEGPIAPKLRNIRKAADRAALLTRQLLIFSRRQVTQPVPLDLGHMVLEHQAMLETLVGERGRVVVRAESGRDPVLLDPTGVSQVLFNLAANARDALTSPGTLTIETSRLDVAQAPPAGFTEVPPGAYVLLRVADTGRGMPPHVLEHLFEPFFTTKGAGLGTGLGLSTVYGIVKKAGGHLSVVSKEGRGTTFQLLFPVAKGVPPVARSLRDSQVVERPRGGSESVLLVEDHDEVREALRETLEGVGYRVAPVMSAEAALMAIRETVKPFALLVTDVALPGMDGAELARRAVAENPALAVLLISGFIPDPKVEGLVRQEGFAFLQKPFAPERFLQSARELIDLKHPRRSS